MTDKKKIQSTAEIYFVKLGFNQKEISAKLGVSEKTISTWASKGRWKEMRDAHLNGGKKRIDDIKEVIAVLTERRLEIFKQEEDALIKGDKTLLLSLKKEAINNSLEVANFNKALIKLEVETKVSLSVYLEVMEDIFKELQTFNPALFAQTLDFQDQHLDHISNRLG